jgi:hypothetical protein
MMTRDRAGSPERHATRRVASIGLLAAALMTACTATPAAAPAGTPSDAPAAAAAATAAAATAAPATAAPATANAAPSVCPSIHGGVCLGPLEAGTYTTRAFKTPLTYTVPDGWANYEDLLGNFLLVPPSGSLEGVDAGTSDYIGVYDGVAPASGDCQERRQDDVALTPEAMAAWYASHPGLAVEGPKAVTIGGLDGVVLDLTIAEGDTGVCRVPDFDGPFVPVLIGAGPAELAHALIEGLIMRLYLVSAPTGEVIAIEIDDLPGGDTMESMTQVVEDMQFGTVTPSASPIDHGSGTGPWILYQFYDVAQAAPDLGLIRPDGTDNHRLPGGPGNRWHPDWSPDGMQIAYDWATPADVAEIAIVGLDGSGERSLLECVDPCFGNGGPAWSPDGRSIGFDGAEGPTPEHAGDLCYLAILNLDSGEARRFLEHEGCSYADSYLRFSPDGERVVFQRQGPAGLAIFTASIDGQEELQLTEWGLGVRPDWSPDGEWIVFMSVEPETNPGRAISLHRVRPDGTDLEHLTNPTGTIIDLYPRWLPDSSGIIFSRCPEVEAASCETRTISPDGSDDRLLLAPFTRHAVHVMWQPSTED